MRAGGFWRGEIGAQVPIANLPLSVELDAGYLYAEGKSNIDDAKGNFKRNVFNAIPFFHYDRYRIGVGVTQHFNVAFTNNPDGSNNSFRFDYDDATGVVLQADARYDQSLMFGFRFTAISYESNDSDLDLIESLGFAEAVSYVRGLREINGNSFGFHVIGTF